MDSESLESMEEHIDLLETHFDTLLGRLEDLMVKVRELGTLETENWDVGSHCLHVEECIDKIDRAILNRDFASVEIVFGEFERYSVVLDYFDSAPVSDQTDKAVELAKAISEVVISLISTLRELKKLY